MVLSDDKECCICKQEVGWGCASDLWSLTADLRYVYDLPAVPAPGAQSQALQAGEWNLIEVLDATDSNTVAKTYTWGLDLSGSLQGAGGVGGFLSVTVHSDTGDTAYYPTYDANGNISEYVNDSDSVVAHYEYSPFGKITSSSGSKSSDFNHRFSTKYLDDETGLYYYGYRYYSNELGRWLNRDPIGERGGTNLYCFVENRPVFSFDARGLKIELEDKCSPEGAFKEVSAIGHRVVIAGADPEAIEAGEEIVSMLGLTGKAASSTTNIGGIQSPVDPNRVASFGRKTLEKIYTPYVGSDIYIDVKYKRCEKKTVWLVCERLDWVEKTKKNADECHVDKRKGEVTSGDISACKESVVNNFSPN